MHEVRTCQTPNCERTFVVGGKTGRPPVHCDEHRNASRRRKARPTPVDIDPAGQPA
jgi:hypothetical protein